MKNRSVRAVILYCLGFAVLNLLLILVLGNDNQVSWALLRWFDGLTPAMVISILFVIQELLLFIILGLSLYCRRSSLTPYDWFKYFQDRRQWKGWKNFWIYVPLALIVYFIFSAVLAGIVFGLGIEIPGLFGEQLVMNMLKELPLLVRYDYMLVILLTMFLGPIVEELIYRGFVTDILMTKYRARGVVAGASLFAVAHLERGVVLNLFILALFMGYIYRKTKSMRYSFLFHLCINGLAVMVLIISRLYPELIVGLI